MPRHPHSATPVSNSERGARERCAAASTAEGLARRGDGRLDWSIAMAKAQDGDQVAYRRLLESVTPYVRTLAARYFRSGDDIEDVVQDVLLTLHLVRRTYDPARPFGPWLVAIANRRIVDALRRRGRVGSYETPLDLELETFMASEANLQEDSLDARVLKEVIEQLPTGQREAIRMLKLEDMSLQEAAATSGMSVAALKVAVHRAKKRLRELLQKRGSES